MGNSKKSTDYSAGEDMKGKEPLLTVVEVQTGETTVRISVDISQKAEDRITI